MGFGSEIYKVNKRSDKELSIRDYFAIDDYFNYVTNQDFYKSQFATVEDYFNRYTIKNNLPDIDTMKLFEQDYKMREYTKSIFEEVESWCSSGACFHNWIIDNLSDEGTESDNETIRLTKEKCLRLLKHCIVRLNELEFVPVQLTRAFTEKWDHDKIGCSTITSVPCDGIEVADDNGNFMRLYGEDQEETDIYTLKDTTHRGSYDKYVAYKQLCNAVVKLLCETDWDKQEVFYSGGW